MPTEKRGRTWSTTRRRVILGLTASTALAGVHGLSGVTARALGADLDQRLLFLKNSSLITGVALDRTYLELADLIWNELWSNANLSEREGITRMMGRLAPLSELSTDDEISAALDQNDPMLIWAVKRLAELWYTGYRFGYNKPLTVADKDPVVIYDEALVWQACEWTKPPVTCGGPFGYWHFSPEGVTQPGWGGTPFGFPDFSNIGKAPIGTGS